MKPRISLLTMALLGLTNVYSHRLEFNATSNCTGTYYEDIKFVEVKCVDDEGVLSSRTEQFYKAPLKTVCDTI
jgi:hypothetical protein